MREAQKLLKMKDQLEEAKSDTDKAEGRLGAAMDSLRKEFSHTTLKQAGKEEEKIATTIAELQGEIRQGVEELEDGYEWD
jgi:hypothetical protein